MASTRDASSWRRLTENFYAGRYEECEKNLYKFDLEPKLRSELAEAGPGEPRHDLKRKRRLSTWSSVVRGILNAKFGGNTEQVVSHNRAILNALKAELHKGHRHTLDLYSCLLYNTCLRMIKAGEKGEATRYLEEGICNLHESWCRALCTSQNEPDPFACTVNSILDGPIQRAPARTTPPGAPKRGLPRPVGLAHVGLLSASLFCETQSWQSGRLRCQAVQSLISSLADSTQTRLLRELVFGLQCLIVAALHSVDTDVEDLIHMPSNALLQYQNTGLSTTIDVVDTECTSALVLGRSRLCVDVCEKTLEDASGHAAGRILNTYGCALVAENRPKRALLVFKRAYEICVDELAKEIECDPENSLTTTQGTLGRIVAFNMASVCRLIGDEASRRDILSSLLRCERWLDGRNYIEKDETSHTPDKTASAGKSNTTSARVGTDCRLRQSSRGSCPWLKQETARSSHREEDNHVVVKLRNEMTRRFSVPPKLQLRGRVLSVVKIQALECLTGTRLWSERRQAAAEDGDWYTVCRLSRGSNLRQPEIDATMPLESALDRMFALAQLQYYEESMDIASSEHWPSSPKHQLIALMYETDVHFGLGDIRKGWQRIERALRLAADLSRVDPSTEDDYILSSLIRQCRNNKAFLTAYMGDIAMAVEMYRGYFLDSQALDNVVQEQNMVPLEIYNLVLLLWMQGHQDAATQLWVKTRYWTEAAKADQLTASLAQIRAAIDQLEQKCPTGEQLLDGPIGVHSSPFQTIALDCLIIQHLLRRNPPGG